MARRAKAEAEEREKMRKRVELEGWRLVAVRAAEKAGFWYTENLELGFFNGGEEPFSLAPPSMAVYGYGYGYDSLLSITKRVFGIISPEFFNDLQCIF
ncbi:hypothetical protein TorRG33x02_234250 [Trema orientale]|uniref:Uncharacterized protein n=1 Tax=Trema orientale TaxID=63057 RepID=A0A2P5E4F9_TREOI|nr:hypothetical protein TorRG33x02_234250 [Trema orientale]